MIRFEFIIFLIIIFGLINLHKVHSIENDDNNDKNKSPGQAVFQNEYNSRHAKKYEFGKRVTGDALVNVKEDKQTFTTPTNVSKILRYPDNGEAETITYVLILVDQSVSDGEGYLSDGGINKKFIQITVEANNTTHFEYNASFYGIPKKS